MLDRVDEWSNSSRCRIVSVYLSRTWCLYTWSFPGYRHNYLKFYQLPNSNLFTHHLLFFSREATSETYGPRVSFLLYCISFIYIASRLLFCNLYFPIYTTKIPKIFTLLSLLDLTFASDRQGIDNPCIVLVARFLIVCAGTRDLRVVSYMIDTLVLKKWGKYLCYFAASPFPLQGKTNAVLKR